jgi:hypothetical protein
MILFNFADGRNRGDSARRMIEENGNSGAHEPSRLEHHEPNLPRAESVRAYLVKARAQARALLIIYIDLR